MIKTISPTTEKVLAQYPQHSEAEVSQHIAALAATQKSWAASTFALRKTALQRIAQQLRERKSTLAALANAEMGKLVMEAEAEIEKCAICCEYYAEHGERFLADQTVSAVQPKSYIHFAPLGIIFAIMPWNFPYWQVLRFAAPAIMAGNTVLLKHATNVTGCALALQELFAGIIPGEVLLRTAVIEGKNALHWIGHPSIAAVSFTGSTAVGKTIGEAAGRHLKKSVLELGGSDPYIVLADANLDSAAKACAHARLINAGQSCIAAKRFIVEAPIYDDFVRLLAEHMKTPPLAPLAREDLRLELHRQVRESIEQGARLIIGGEVPPWAGFFYPATILSEVTPKMPAFTEELFGPVAAVIRAQDADQAVELANQTLFGLGGAVFTRNHTLGESIARDRLQAGSCFINTFVRSDPTLPFGGIKESGFGRELSHFGIQEFVNIKTIYREA